MGFNLFTLLLISLIAELVYFKIADKYNIIDKPNARSSHVSITIRGGGVVFPLVFLLALPAATFEHCIPFCISLMIISVISFLDDIMSLNSTFRLAIQSIAVITVLLQFSNALNLYQLIVAFVIFTGVINAYNFMDGINGITALYSLVTIGSLFWINTHTATLLPDILFAALSASLLVFSFYNIRIKARCFAGDVGSVSMAFIICFLLLSLMVKTATYTWILFLGIYGIDAVFTILCRIVRKEPILKAHRSHFYQFMANELKMSHVLVSIIYALAQLLLNILVIYSYQATSSIIAIVGLFVFLLIYLIFRLRLEGRYRLFMEY